MRQYLPERKNDDLGPTNTNRKNTVYRTTEQEFQERRERQIEGTIELLGSGWICLNSIRLGWVGSCSRTSSPVGGSYPCKPPEATEMASRGDGDGEEGDSHPKLYYAVRRGRFVDGAVYSSWEQAKKQILGYPRATYIATPTMAQASRYVNGFGEFSRGTAESGGGAVPEGSQRDGECGSQRDGKRRRKGKGKRDDKRDDKHDGGSSEGNHDSRPRRKRRGDKRFGAKTRRLLLDYYRLCLESEKGGLGAPRQQKNQRKAPTVEAFLRERGVLERKYDIFVKHWQRSGLLICSHECIPFWEAACRYDLWIAERYGTEEGEADENESDSENKNQSLGDGRALPTKATQRKRAARWRSSRQRTAEQPVARGARSETDAECSIAATTTTSSGSSDAYFDSSCGGSPAKQSARNVARKRKSSSARASTKRQTTRARKAPPSSSCATATATAKPKRSKPKLPLQPDLEALLSTATVAPGYGKNDDKVEEHDEEDYDEEWNRLYERLVAFHGSHGHCNVPMSADKELAHWVRYNHRRMLPGSGRGGARSLTRREEKLLNELSFNPRYEKTVSEFGRYLGLRVAKLFDVVGDEDDDGDKNNNNNNNNGSGDRTKAIRIERKPFFGTVCRISSVSNRYLRVQYDDGDSEDYDEACLGEGLRVYALHKHDDPLFHKQSTGNVTKENNDNNNNNNNNNKGTNMGKENSTTTNNNASLVSSSSSSNSSKSLGKEGNPGQNDGLKPVAEKSNGEGIVSLVSSSSVRKEGRPDQNANPLKETRNEEGVASCSSKVSSLRKEGSPDQNTRATPEKKMAFEKEAIAGDSVRVGGSDGNKSPGSRPSGEHQQQQHQPDKHFDGTNGLQQQEQEQQPDQKSDGSLETAADPEPPTLGTEEAVGETNGTSPGTSDNESRPQGGDRSGADADGSTIDNDDDSDVVFVEVVRPYGITTSFGHDLVVTKSEVFDF
ncbi:unnamed protein product [Pseudo-nitzschia multistriata]|uniref:Uncharacterized protein n=1 Tax=Pseudo-nitzschia multistriata TaxID=183589 RepID=A0A448YY48_9STRA|nr:unnamed protein product [Pseudo-nitzschia multistriata]